MEETARIHFLKDVFATVVVVAKTSSLMLKTTTTKIFGKKVN